MAANTATKLLSVNRGLSGVIAELIDRPRVHARVYAQVLENNIESLSKLRERSDRKAHIWSGIAATTLIGSFHTLCAFGIEAIGIPLFSDHIALFFTGMGSAALGCSALQVQSSYRKSEVEIRGMITMRENALRALHLFYDKMTQYRVWVAMSSRAVTAEEINQQVEKYNKESLGTSVSLSQAGQLQKDVRWLAEEGFFEAEKFNYQRLGLDPAFALRGDA